jgi:uncharacterized protein YjbI with pentapeptide repeats
MEGRQSANLSHASLKYGEVNDANMSKTDLGGTDLSDAYVYSTKLSGADLSGAILSGATGVTAQRLERQILPEASYGLEGVTMPDGSTHP